MKTFLTLTVVTILFMGLVFSGMPLIIKKETAGLETEVQRLTAKIVELEKFRGSQEKSWKLTGLKPGDDFKGVVKALGNLSMKIAAMEERLSENIHALENRVKEQAGALENILAIQSETNNRLTEDIANISNKIHISIATIKIIARLVETKIELASKNMGNAKASLQVISDELEKAKGFAEENDKKGFDQLIAISGNIKSEIDISPTGANNMINFFWYELEKLTGSP